MEKAKLLVVELATLIGIEIELTNSGICELSVEDRLILLRYRPENNDWLYFGLVTNGTEAPSQSLMEKALALNLFGAGTLGLHLGLFGQSLVLSGTASFEDLNAEKLAEKLLFLARQIGHIVEKLDETSTIETREALELSPFSTSFIQV